MNLCHRGVLDNPTCEACSLSNETSGHLFWDFTSARETWEAAGIPIDLRGVQYREFIDLLWHLIFVQHVGMNLLKFVITTAWCKWFRRNKTRLGAPQQSCREIIHKARTMLEDVRLAHLRIPQHKDAADIRWTPPDFPKYKVNTDVAVFSNTKAVGIGVVVRDHEGAVIAALSKRLSLPLGPLEAEAKARMKQSPLPEKLDYKMLSSKPAQPSSIMLSLVRPSLRFPLTTLLPTFSTNCKNSEDLN